MTTMTSRKIYLHENFRRRMSKQATMSGSKCITILYAQHKSNFNAPFLLQASLERSRNGRSYSNCFSRTSTSGTRVQPTQQKIMLHDVRSFLLHRFKTSTWQCSAQVTAKVFPKRSVSVLTATFRWRCSWLTTACTKPYQRRTNRPWAGTFY